MDAVKKISLVEHIRKRLGMYWPTHDGIPDASVWKFSLDQLANEMGAAFMRGEASYVDIRYDSGSKTMSIECDGRAATDGERIFMDIAFCTTLSNDERLFVMAHEVWHCVRSSFQNSRHC